MSYNRLRELRKKVLKIGSSEKLAERLGGESAGWYHQKIQRIESGNTSLTDVDAWHIAKSLNVPIYALFIDPEEVYPENHRKIVSAYLALSDGMREAVDLILFPGEAGAQAADHSLTAPASHALHDQAGENAVRKLTPLEIDELRRRFREGSL